jgi:hypothetical protein
MEKGRFKKSGEGYLYSSWAFLFGFVWFCLVLLGFIWICLAGPPPSIAGVSPPCRPTLLEERADALDRIGFGEIVDHRQGGDRVGFVERPLNLGVERPLADRQGRRGLLRDRFGQRLRLLERAALGNHAVDETEAFGFRGAIEPPRHRHLHRPLARYGAAYRHQRGRAE